jgi:pilus assembly protein CpaB
MLIAKAPIPAQTVVREDQFIVKQCPLRYLPEGSIQETRDAVGRFAKWDISPGDPLLVSKLSTSNESQQMVLPIPPGKRAIAVAVDEVVGVAGFIQPSSRVDVIASWERDEKAVSKVVLQNILVLAVAQNSQLAENPKAKLSTSVTLAVTLAEAEKLILVNERGRIRLAMRTPQEKAVVRTSGATFESAKPAKPSKPASPEKVRVAQRQLPPLPPQPKEERGDAITLIRGTQALRVYQ